MELSLSLETLPNIFDSPMARVYSPLLLEYSLALMPFDLLPLVPLLSAFDVIFSATIKRTAHHIRAPTAIYPHRDILPLLVFDSNAISVVTGDIVTDSVPTESVVFVIPLATSLMTVQLNICLPHSRLRSLEDLNSVTSRGLIIEPGAQLYEGGNVTVLFPYHSVLLFFHTQCLLTWRGRRLYTNTAYLFFRTASSFCFFDLSMDLANS